METFIIFEKRRTAKDSEKKIEDEVDSRRGRLTEKKGVRRKMREEQEALNG